jgi:hypothetical protein
MKAPAVAPARAADADVLRACLEEQVVPRLTGRRRPVVDVERKPAATSGSYGAYTIRARFADGRALRLFLKDYGTSSRPRRDLRARRERELAVYRELLSPPDLGTARHLGAAWDDAARRHWLLLELVEGSLLRDLDLECWFAPLEWLGQLHGRFVGAWDAAAAPPFLERHDEGFFRDKAGRALAAVGSRAPRLAARMALVAERLQDVLPVLTTGPRTLVHGAFLPANVIVTPAEPARICAVDWELAAVGAPFYDLASFCDGFEAPTLDRMLAAYRRGAEAGGLALPPDREIVRSIDCFRLHRVMDMLAVADEKRYPDEAIERLVSRGEALGALVEARA